MNKRRGASRHLHVLRCSFCGIEVAQGEQYWYINGAVVCAECLPEFARRDYLAFHHIRGEERGDDAS